MPRVNSARCGARNGVFGPPRGGAGTLSGSERAEPTSRPGCPVPCPGVNLFPRSWTVLRAAVAGLPDEYFARPSGCAGRLVRDLVRHRAVDAQDVLITW
jgi:hypothetical protein